MAHECRMQLRPGCVPRFYFLNVPLQPDHVILLVEPEGDVSGKLRAKPGGHHSIYCYQQDTSFQN